MALSFRRDFQRRLLRCTGVNFKYGRFVWHMHARVLAQQLQRSGGAVMAEQIVAMIVGLSGSAGELAQLHTQLKQSITGRQHYVLQTHLLEQLDPSVHSLGYLFLL